MWNFALPSQWFSALSRFSVAGADWFLLQIGFLTFPSPLVTSLLPTLSWKWTQQSPWQPWALRLNGGVLRGSCRSKRNNALWGTCTSPPLLLSYRFPFRLVSLKIGWINILLLASTKASELQKIILICAWGYSWLNPDLLLCLNWFDWIVRFPKCLFLLFLPNACTSEFM